MCSPLSARALKSQLTGQSSTGRCWNPPKTSEPMKFLACLNNRATISNVFWKLCYIHLSSVQFSRSVMSDSLQPHELQHTRPPCLSLTPRVHSDSRPSSQWCHPAISSSVVPFSSCPQSLSASKSFPMSQHFAWGGQSTGVSALASVLPMNTQDGSPLGWTG